MVSHTWEPRELNPDVPPNLVRGQIDGVGAVGAVFGICPRGLEDTPQQYVRSEREMRAWVRDKA